MDLFSYGNPKKYSSITELLISKYKSKLSDAERSESAPTEGNDHDDTNNSGTHWGSGIIALGKMWTQYVFGYFQGHSRSSCDFTEKEQVENLLVQKKNATSYGQWQSLSLKLDELQQFDKWKQEKESPLYDYQLIEKSLNELREARLSGDIRRLLYLIRTTWVRNIGNIGNVNLYRHSHTGTKVFIQEYLDECNLALEAVTKHGNEHGLDDRYILGMLIQTRKNVGRTALVLSGGGCFGLFHIGVLAALLEENLLPRIISGSSAGAIVASVLCVHTTDEIVELIGSIVEQKFEIFGAEGSKQTGFLVCLSRFLKYGTWFDNESLQKTMIDFLGDLTFREAFNRTGNILNITVSPASIHEQPRLLNYLTAPSVLIWSAVCASCSLPGVFPSTVILEKNIKTGAVQEWHHTSVKFVDGSVDNDLPITRLSEMFNVDHIIACQVNPHVVPFLRLSVTCVGGEIENEYSAKFKTKLGNIYEIWSAEVIHYLQMLAEVGIARNLCTKLRSVLSQQYSGNITILLDLQEVFRLNKLLANPTPEYLLHSTMKGARATWPKISIIRNHCGIEFALDNAIKYLKSKNFKNLSDSLSLVSSPGFFSERANDKLLNRDLILLDSTNTNFTPRRRELDGKSRHMRRRSDSLAVGKLKIIKTTSNSQLHHKRRGSQEIPSNLHRSYSASTKFATDMSGRSPVRLQSAPSSSGLLNYNRSRFSSSSRKANSITISPTKPSKRNPEEVNWNE